MFRNAYQNGFLSILYSCGSSPLAIWDKQVKNGYIKRVTDDEVKSLVLEIAGTNVATTFISCPQDPKKVLGIKLPFLIMIIKNMKKYFTFEITILDDKNMHRRFRVSNFQSTTRVRPFCTTMPIGLSGGWNQIQFNLADFTRRAYGSNYIETTRMQIHANCRIRRIYYADRLYSEDEMPEEFKLFLPIRRRGSTQEGRGNKTVSNNNKRAGDERLANEPPPFASIPDGGESKALESGAINNNFREELAPGNSQNRFEIAQRMSETGRGSNSETRKSLSATKHEARGKPVGVTVGGTSKEEIPAVHKGEGIATVEEGDEKEEEEDVVGVEERVEDGKARGQELDDLSRQRNLEKEEVLEIEGNVNDGR